MALCTLVAPASAKEKTIKSEFKFAGKWRTYYSFIPDEQAPLPLVLLLHGSGRDGQVVVDAWKGLAAKEKFIIVGPDSFDPWAWQSDKDSPNFLRAVVEQVNAKHPIDASRIYLFGHSGGAVYALLLALVESEFFAATAVHAGQLHPENYNLFAKAHRHMPIAIWVGDQDTSFPVDMVKTTVKEFQSRGFQVELTVIPNGTHRYEQDSDRVNSGAWEFFQKARLGNSDSIAKP